MATQQSVRPTKLASPVWCDRPEPITLGMTQPMAEALARLSAEMGVPLEKVLSEAVALLMVAVDGQKRGYGVCLVDEESNVVEEIVNFGIAEEDEVEPSPSVGSPGLDS
jgi:hypothetical protein